MTYKGDTIIGKPSLSLVEIYIAEKGLFCDAKECFEYWENKNWQTRKGVEVKTLESAINVYNGIAVQRVLPKERRTKKELASIKKKCDISRLKQKTLSYSDFIKIYFPKTKKEYIENRRLYFGRCKQGAEYILYPTLICNFPKDKKQEVKEYILSLPYDEFLNSMYWKIISSTVKHNAKKCSMCGKRTSLQTHHKTYKHHGEELDHMDDLVVVCRDCHQKIHNIK